MAQNMQTCCLAMQSMQIKCRGSVKQKPTITSSKKVTISCDELRDRTQRLSADKFTGVSDGYPVISCQLKIKTMHTVRRPSAYAASLTVLSWPTKHTTVSKMLDTPTELPQQDPCLEDPCWPQHPLRACSVRSWPAHSLQNKGVQLSEQQTTSSMFAHLHGNLLGVERAQK